MNRNVPTFQNASLPEQTCGRHSGQSRTSTAAERIPELDILRGVALLGILLMNIQDFAGFEGLWDIPVGLSLPAFTGWHKQLDYAIVAFNWMFVEGKMRSLFAMLFGAGTVLLTTRLEERYGSARTLVLFYRRNLCLLLFGLLHGFLLWYGDILLDYSLMALLFLYPLRRLSGRALLIAGLSVGLVGGTMGSARAFHVAETLQQERQILSTPGAMNTTAASDRGSSEEEGSRKRAEAVNAHRVSFLSGLTGRAHAEIDVLLLKYRSLWALEWLGAMLTGMGLLKLGYFYHRFRRKTYFLVAAAGYSIALPLVITGLWHTCNQGFSEPAFARWIVVPYTIEVYAGSLANLSVILLILRTARIRERASWIAAVGKTAFSDYILTTLLCQYVFIWSRWNLYDRLPFYQWYVAVGIIWCINIAFGSLWLRYFRLGPLEWAWRSLTYLEVQPLLKSDREYALSMKT